MIPLKSLASGLVPYIKPRFLASCHMLKLVTGTLSTSLCIYPLRLQVMVTAGGGCGHCYRSKLLFTAIRGAIIFTIFYRTGV